MTKITPMMAQWNECKLNARGALLLFRLGDFYEAFEDDAKIMAEALDITLTKRHETPMAGIPFHAAEGYINTLISKGYQIAIAEQVEEAAPGKGIVKREIVKRLSPGTYVGAEGTSEKSNNFFVSIFESSKNFGLAALDLSTGEFKTCEFDKIEYMLSEAISLKPSEILVGKKFESKHPLFIEELKIALKPLITIEEDWRFQQELTYSSLIHHFKTQTLDGFGLNGMLSGTSAAGALLTHLKETLSQPVEHITKISTWSPQDFLFIDRITQRNLELTESLWDQSRRNTLLEILDFTKTPMGARLIASWIKQPLYQLEKIKTRQNALESLLTYQLSLLQEHLSKVRDLERLVMKISSLLANPRDLISLKTSLKSLPEIKDFFRYDQSNLIQVLTDQISLLTPLVDLIESAIIEEPPVRLSEGSCFKLGYHSELDELKNSASGSKDWLANYQAELKEITGIKTLKVGYTKISGFYIEVTHGQSAKVPDNFKRKQTLTNAERYLTPELKDYEEKILGAEEKIGRLELQLFRELQEKIKPSIESILENAHALAFIDALQSLAFAAKERAWNKPELSDGRELYIKEGRHPIIEAKASEPFIPNDTALNGEDERMMLITGPNMAGKSTYIRQTALIVLLAQMGSFVPAAKAKIGLVDKLFTRIGASDDLTRGQSTFMVEMTETANILNNATNASLVILDEIGRGTSTYDGISIAWSVAEYLLTEENRQAKTLFATHFWELTKLEERKIGAKNYTVAVHESDDDIRFLRKIVSGGTDKSYGIHVGKLAGLPAEVLLRAKEILSHLEETANRDKIFEPTKSKAPPKKAAKKVARRDSPNQLMLF